MKQRVISALVGLAILFAVLFLYNTIFFNFAVSLVSAVAVFELLHATGYVKSRLILVYSLAYALVVPFFSTLDIRGMQIWVTVGYFTLMFATLLAQHEKIRVEEIAVAFFFSLLVPMALSTVVLMRDRFDHGIFYTLLICVAAWVADSAAYFVGRACGKHKLAPLVSPHKTVEGAVGGVVVSAGFFLLFCLGYEQVMLHVYSQQIEIAWLHALWIGMFCSVMGIFGDLMASVVKRQAGIKDFGKIMPGHGGVMDRFDSFLFVAPALYLVLQIFPIIA
ncbi:MAG: phosphatidate cytidylyltransferase [Oscillospiraceae bacterium]|nr:phosphatidate cytidylyltransferase [Oscillospiraceae bacterium]